MRFLLVAMLCLGVVPPAFGAEPDPAPKQASGAWAWGILLPGLGQIVLGEPWRGVAFMGATYGVVLAGVGTGVWIQETWPTPAPAGPPYSHNIFNPALVGTLVGLGLAMGVWTWSVVDAYGLDVERARP